MNTQPEELKAHYSNPKFDGLPWAVDRTRKQKAKVSGRGSEAKAQDAANKIMLAFQSGGIAPLDPARYAKIEEHVRSILGRAMENKQEKRKRKWAGFERAKKEASAS
jgi:hypothetical protein